MCIRDSYFSFHCGDGHVAFDVTLPEKVYQVYLTGLLATGDMDKSDMNAIDSKICLLYTSQGCRGLGRGVLRRAFRCCVHDAARDADQGHHLHRYLHPQDLHREHPLQR